jgi:hypothetical protein
MKSPLDWALFINTMHTLIHKNTLIIDADYGEDDTLVQRLTRIAASDSRHLLEALWKCPKTSIQNEIPEPKANLEITPNSNSSLTVTTSITLLILT